MDEPRLLHQPNTSDAVHPLSQRERECLLWIARGKTYQETAMILGLSFGTIKTNLDSVRYKLNCATMAQATARSVIRGILTEADLERY